MKNLLVCISLFWSVLAWADKPPLSLEDIAQLRKVVSVAMAPDGEHMAVTLTRRPELFSDAHADGIRDLYIVDNQRTIKPYVTRGDAIGALRWSSDSQNLWFLAKRQHEKHIALYTISLHGGEANLAVKHEGNIKGFALHPKGKKLLYWATPPPSPRHKALKKKGFHAQVFEEAEPLDRLYEVDLSKDSSNHRHIPIERHIVRAAYVPDSDLVMVQCSPSSLTDDVIMLKSVAIFRLDGTAHSMFKHQGKMGKAAISPDGEHVALIGTNDPSDPAEGRLMVGSLKDSSVKDILPGVEGHVRDVFWLGDEKIGFVLHRGTRSVLASKNIDNVSGNFRSLERQAGIHMRASASQNGKDIAVVVHSQDHPTEAFWYTRKSMVRITDSNPWLRKRQFATQRVMEYQARDGLELEGILVAPADIERPLPLLIFAHGGPEAHYSDGWLNRYASPAHVAANHGYVAFFPNYRGSTGRGVAFTKLGQADYAGAEFNDLVDAKRHLVEMGLADPDKVGISGASYGGYAAAWAATKLTDEFAASVATMSVTNQLSKFGLTDIPNEMKQQHALSWPWERWQWMWDRSPIAHAGQSRTPLLLLHGMLDARVPASQSRELYRHMKLQGKTVRLVEYPDEGHGFFLTTSRYDYSRRLMRWMDHYLKGKEQTMPPWQLPYPITDTTD